MHVTTVEHREAPSEQHAGLAGNGAALAAFMAAGVGSFAMGLVVILNEAGLFTAPSLYGPAGGVSGRTTIAVVLWLLAWAVLHRICNSRQLDARRAVTITAILTTLGILGTFPPLWALL
jgi:hypothetical protein